MMEEGEATQEPTAPESAPASPPPEQDKTPAESEASPETEATSATAESEAPQAGAAVESSQVATLHDWSHVRGFQAVESAPEALASRGDYAEELAKELGVRAARFARSVDESIVLSSDGLLRWLGDPVARVVAGEPWLQPRGVLLADDALAGEDRAGVENRVALWLSAHMRKVLGPLTALAEGVELPEAARALGAKIADALGVLEREGVRNEVRALDQTARGALRKLGVRFGSLYIYVPVLLKPGARALCSLLWTLKRGPEPGADRLLAFAAAGRTSFANEGLLSPDAYRVAGFRLCGERVVRVDIIERLTDLIRAAIPDYMRAGSRPMAEGYGFLVTPQMTSLTGCSGEAFASILRSLGFEPVKVSRAAYEAARPKAPTEPLKPAAPAPETPAEAAAEPDSSTASAEEGPQAEGGAEPAAEEAAPETPAETAEPEAATAAEPECATESAEEPPQAEGEAEPAEQEAAPESVDAEPAIAEAEVPAEPVATERPLPLEAIATAEDLDAAEPPVPVAEASAPSAEEELEIWRPAPRRPRAPRAGHEAGREGRANRERPHRRHGRPAEAAAEGSQADPRPQPGPRPPRPERRDEEPRRFEGKGKEERRDDRRPQKNFGPRRDQRPAQVDPDSPFAKLAALKPLLERRDKRP